MPNPAYYPWKLRQQIRALSDLTTRTTAVESTASGAASTAGGAATAASAAGTVANAVTTRVDVIEPRVINTIGQPSVSPGAQLFTGTLNVSVSAAAGVTIRYTQDGTEVTSASPEWPGGLGAYTTLALSATTILRVRGFSGTGWSPEYVATYTLNTTASRAATPAYYAAATNTYGLYSASPSPTIMFRVNGGSYAAYSSPFTLLSGQHLEAYATSAGLSQSAQLDWTRP